MSAASWSVWTLLHSEVVQLATLFPPARGPRRAVMPLRVCSGPFGVFPSDLLFAPAGAARRYGRSGDAEAHICGMPGGLYRSQHVLLAVSWLVAEAPVHRLAACV